MSIVRTLNCRSDLIGAKSWGDNYPATDGNNLGPWGETCWRLTAQRFEFPAIQEGGCCGWYATPGNNGAGDSGFTMREGATDQLKIIDNQGDAVLHYTYAGSEYGHPSYVFDTQRHVWMEMEWKIDDSAGYWRVWLDGDLVVDVSGDTRNGGAVGEIDTIYFYRTASQAGWCDTWVFWTKDGSGLDAAPGTELRLWRHHPSGDTAELDWTTTGGAHYTEIDEDTTADGATTVIESVNVGDRDRIEVESFLGGVDYKGDDIEAIVSVSARALPYEVTATGTFDLGVRELENDTEDVTSVTAIANWNNAEREHIAELNPDTGLPWTLADLVTGVEFVVEQQ